MRSCVMGRGVATFSISSAIAFASYTPTQMGSTVLPFRSLRITMGMLVTGSIMSPRIFISTSMAPSQTPLHHSYALAHQRVGARARHAHLQIPADQRIVTACCIRKIQRAIVGRPPDPLTQRLIAALYENFANGANQLGIAPDLD